MAKFYTQTGDDGYTGLLGEGRTPKYNHRIETIGAIDEANAALGIARSLCILPTTASIILKTQKDLYHIMAEVATLPKNASRFRNISGESVEWLECQISDLSTQVTNPQGFIVPGDSKAAAAIDLARTIIRRAERRIAYLIDKKMLENQELLRYMNRLSSLCFILELLEIQAAGITNPTFAKE